MARLCTELNPLLDKNILKKLYQRKLYSALDILQEDPEKVVQITGLSYKEVLQLCKNIAANYSAFPHNGVDYYNEIISNAACIQTGIESLDNMIEGGFQTGKLYELCGTSGSGKTQLCHTISINVALNLNQRIEYIDTKSDFSGKRIQEILDAKGCSDEVMGAVMENIQVTRIPDVYELFSFLQHLKTLNHEQTGSQNTRIVILDSLAVLFFPFLGKNLNDGFGLMNQLANTIRYIANEHHMVFIIMNLAMQCNEEDNLSEPNTEFSVQEDNHAIWETMKPALGKYWLDIPCTRLLIHKGDFNEQRQISVIKSTYLAIGKFCKVTICNKGVISD